MNMKIKIFFRNGTLLEAYSILVVAGETILKHSHYAYQWSRVKKIYVHPDFELEFLKDDAALLKVSVYNLSF